MKRKISLFLALVMLLGCFAGLTAAAEGETPVPAAYQPEIAYTNVAYTEGIVLMFAVNAPAELPEGASVELLVWDGIDGDVTYSASDEYVYRVTESEPVTISGANYLAFKYSRLSAEMMTDIIYVRPLYTDANGKRTYGDLVDYSVVEYVKVANGEFEGFAGLAEDKKNLLNSLLNFGAMAQIYLGDDGDIYAPNGYLANDTLNKIWITPVIGGVAQDKVFGGFFEYEQNGVATVHIPFYDVFELSCLKGADGTVLTDVDGTSNGIQVTLTAEGDLELTAEYKNRAFFDADVSVNSIDACLNSTAHTPEKAYGYYDAEIGGFSFNTSGGYKWKDYCYNSIDVIDDPYNEGEKTYRWVCSNTSSLQLGDSKDEFNNGYRLSKSAVFGDTVAPVVTIELVLGGTANSVDINLGNFRIRGTGTGDLLIPFMISKGQVCVYTANNKTSYTPLSVKIPKDGYAKYAIVIDFGNEVISAYVEGENGKMIKEVECTTPYCAGSNVTKMGWLEWAKTNHQKWEWHGGANTYTDEEKALIGEAASPNLDKLAEIANAKNFVLIKDFNVVFGNSAEQ